MALEAFKKYAKAQENFKETPQPKSKEQVNKILTAHMERDKQAWKYNKKQADNIRKSEQLRTKINKGVQNGQDTFTLLLDAIECISLMTGDKIFYEQNIKELKERE